MVEQLGTHTYFRVEVELKSPAKEEPVQIARPRIQGIAAAPEAFHALPIFLEPERQKQLGAAFAQAFRRVAARQNNLREKGRFRELLTFVKKAVF